MLGYVVGGGAWIVTPLRSASAIERCGQAPQERHARRSALNFGVLMGRAWMLGITILVVGLAGDGRTV